MNFLEQIVENKKKEVAKARRKKSSAQLIIELENEQPHRSFFNLLGEKNGFHFICEIKKASPSKGMIQKHFNPGKQAKNYLKGGASAISILTDEKYFQGHLDHLRNVRQIVSLPILRKDFIIDPYQIIESKVAGADMILLIARILTKNQIAVFRNLASELQLDILLEIAKEEDIEKINDFEDVIIGINNRNLKTFEVNLNTSLKIKKIVPPNVPVISESGIQSINDCFLLAESGFRGVLIGETLMRAGNPKELLQEWNRKISDVYQA